MIAKYRSVAIENLGIKYRIERVGVRFLPSRLGIRLPAHFPNSLEFVSQ